MRSRSTPLDTGPRLSSLDGIRAVAVTLVIVAHIRSNQFSDVLPGLWRWDLGNLGVRTFFVLSGFLITTLLIREHAETGTISLKQFYLRRALRIFPAFYLMMGLMVLAWHLGWVTLTWPDVTIASVYLSDFFTIVRPIGHTWSLSVEEQFYLLWPFALRALTPRRAVRFAVVLMFIPPIPRLLLENAGLITLARYGFPTVMDALATGALLAMTRDRLGAWAPFTRLTRTGTGAWLLLAVILLSWVQLPMAFTATVGILLLNVAIALLIEWTLEYRRGWVFSVLNVPLVAYLGRASYSIYLWQSPFLTRGPVFSLWVTLGFIVAMALASYHLVELPFLRLRNRMSLGPRLVEPPALESHSLRA